MYMYILHVHPTCTSYVYILPEFGDQWDGEREEGERERERVWAARELLDAHLG